MWIVGAIAAFLAIGLLVTMFREAISGALGVVIVVATIYLLSRETNKRVNDRQTSDSATDSVGKEESQTASNVWIGTIGFALGGLLLFNAFNPRETLRVVPYGEIVADIPEDLRGRYEACRLQRDPPPALRCSAVEVEWRAAFEAAQARAMRLKQ